MQRKPKDLRDGGERQSSEANISAARRDDPPSQTLEKMIAREAAETIIRELEERGYLDFDGGEQEERAAIVNSILADILSAITKVTEANDAALASPVEKTGEATEKAMIANQVHGMHKSIQSYMEAARHTPEYEQEGRELQEAESRAAPASAVSEITEPFPKPQPGDHDYETPSVAEKTNYSVCSKHLNREDGCPECWPSRHSRQTVDRQEWDVEQQGTLNKQLRELRQELAAERKRHERYEEELTKASEILSFALDQNVAIGRVAEATRELCQRREQDKAEYEAHRSGLQEACDILRDQLLSAQAAIEKIKNTLEDWFENATKAVAGEVDREHLSVKEWSALRQAYAATLAIIPDVGLSLLHQHYAEVRKPLVEALEAVRAQLQWHRYNSPVPVNDDDALKQADAALAQCKS